MTVVHSRVDFIASTHGPFLAAALAFLGNNVVLDIPETPAADPDARFDLKVDVVHYDAFLIAVVALDVVSLVQGSAFRVESLSFLP